MKKVLFLLLILLIAGCKTSYQSVMPSLEKETIEENPSGGCSVGISYEEKVNVKYIIEEGL